MPYAHCTRCEQLSVGARQGHETRKVSAEQRWQGSGPQLTSLVGSISLSMKMNDCMEACPMMAILGVDQSTVINITGLAVYIFTLMVSMVVASQAYAITAHATQ